jgi:hypothetical protein
MKNYTYIVGAYGVIACGICYFFPYNMVEATSGAGGNREKLAQKINPSDFSSTSVETSPARLSSIYGSIRSSNKL